jgi:deazaflavin-dependent oxidoreductase (nitroreductase family)
MATPIGIRIASAIHRGLYRLTRGAIGGRARGVDMLLLTTVGRKTGKRRTTPLMYGKDGEKLVLIASKGGAPEHPFWYTNLKATPDVEVQVRADKLRLRARDATADERPRLWRLMADLWKDYDEYQKKTTREIPVVILEP